MYINPIGASITVRSILSSNINENDALGAVSNTPPSYNQNSNTLFSATNINKTGILTQNVIQTLQDFGVDNKRLSIDENVALQHFILNLYNILTSVDTNNPTDAGLTNMPIDLAHIDLTNSANDTAPVDSTNLTNDTAPVDSTNSANDTALFNNSANSNSINAYNNSNSNLQIIIGEVQKITELNLNFDNLLQTLNINSDSINLLDFLRVLNSNIDNSYSSQNKGYLISVTAWVL